MDEKRIRLISETRKYKVDFLQYTTTGSVLSNCGDITFYNSGSNPVTINNAILLYQGQSVSIQGNNDEMDTTTYTFSFPSSTTLSSNLIVVRKNFIN
jgi:archaellum component FlaF (FlaF/FlaG flagellin family)